MRSALNICKAGNQSGYPSECNKKKSGASVFESNFLSMTFSSEFLSKMSPSSRTVIDPVSRGLHSPRLLRPLHTNPGPLQEQYTLLTTEPSLWPQVVNSQENKKGYIKYFFSRYVVKNRWALCCHRSVYWTGMIPGSEHAPAPSVRVPQCVLPTACAAGHLWTWAQL